MLRKIQNCFMKKLISCLPISCTGRIKKIVIEKKLKKIGEKSKKKSAVSCRKKNQQFENWIVIVGNWLM